MLTPWSKLSIVLLATLTALAVTGCALPYYLQAAGGHIEVMSAREDIEDLLADPELDPELRARLERVREARRFATETLGLPDNDSYTQYAALDRRYVVWNVFAAPALSVEPKTWCFPVSGCVAYRGYFDEADAQDYAASLAEDGYDSYVGGVTAYSTLGTFSDPVLDTMLRYDDISLAELIFHELAHQQLYVKGDSAFNEAYATVVAEAGLQLWLEQQGEDAGPVIAEMRADEDRQAEFTDLLLRTRDRLAEIYTSDTDDSAKLAAKAAAFEQLEQEWETLRARWGDGYGYDGWFSQPLNNARLVPVATYEGLAPGFRRLLSETCEGDIRCFHAEAERLGELEYEARRDVLSALMVGG